MPFTPAHAAAVLPLRRTPLPMAALVCGSMAPDVPYYTPVLPWLWSSSGLTHSVLGTVTADIPLGLALLAIWTALTPPLAALAPAYVRDRVAGLRPGWSLSVVPALWIGALTHVFWDNWTHQYGFFVHHLSPLRASLGGGLSVFNTLQQVSTVVGLLIVGVFLLRWARRTTPHSRPAGLAPRTRRGIVAAIVVVTAGATLRRAVVPLGWDFHGLRLARAVATQAAEGLVIGAALSVAAYAVGWWVIARVPTR